jgi:predicted glycosyltransferase
MECVPLALIHIDVLTPKQALFFDEVAKGLEASGHEILATTRRYREAEDLLKLRRREAVTVGEYGGAALKGKLEASLKRTLDLARLLEGKEPDVSLSFSSPEAARASFGLGIPHIIINDSPHSEAVARLTVPLSRRLLTPYIIPLRFWLRLGATREMIVRYKALDPIVWLRDYKVDPKVLNQLNLSPEKPIVTLRMEETYAAYLLTSARGSQTLRVVEGLIAELKGKAQIVVIPRYEDQAPMLKERFGGEVTLAEKTIDGPSLLAFTSVFIGAGGTMTAEAALLGVPSFSCYPGEPTIVEHFLVRERLVQRQTHPEVMVKRIAHVLGDLDRYRKIGKARATRLISRMEDPVEKIKKTVAEYLPSPTKR